MIKNLKQQIEIVISPPPLLKISFESQPDRETYDLDVMLAYDIAADLQRTNQDNWLTEWAEWLIDELGYEAYHGAIRQLWEVVSRLATEYLDICKKKAEQAVCSLYSMEGLPHSISTSPN